MAKKNIDLNEKLEKLKRPLSRYQKERIQLLKLGFTEEQANRVILRQSSANTIKTLLEKHDQIRTSLSTEEIIRVAAHSGGANNLNAFITAIPHPNPKNF
jgi:chemotaxis response regulator CheB